MWNEGATAFGCSWSLNPNDLKAHEGSLMWETVEIPNSIVFLSYLQLVHLGPHMCFEEFLMDSFSPSATQAKLPKSIPFAQTQQNAGFFHVVWHLDLE